MAKIFTEINLDRVRRMRFGYKTVKNMDKIASEFAGLSEFELLEKLVFLALKEDDPDLQESQIEDFIDEYGVEEIGAKLEETIQRDMPALFNKMTEQKKEIEKDPNE